MEGIINFAGVMPRIGATTQAIQLTAFLRRAGYKAAYVEMNSQDYIWGATMLYQDCVSDSKKGRVTLEGLELYTGEQLKKLKEEREGYDYLICDYGTVRSRNFNTEEFQNGIMILAAGYKPNEIFLTRLALLDAVFKEAIYSFSFVRKEDEADIRFLLQKETKTVFAPYMPDPFFVPDPSVSDPYFYVVMDFVTEILERGSHEI